MLGSVLEHVLDDLQEPVGCGRLFLAKALKHPAKRLREPLHGLFGVRLEVGVVNILVALERAFLQPLTAHDETAVGGGIVVGLPRFPDRLLTVPSATGDHLSGQGAVRSDFVAGFSRIRDPHVVQFSEALINDPRASSTDAIEGRHSIPADAELKLRAAEVPPIPLAALVGIDVTVDHRLQCLPAACLGKAESLAGEVVVVVGLLDAFFRHGCTPP